MGRRRTERRARSVAQALVDRFTNNAYDLEATKQALARAVDHFAEKAPKLAAWLEENVPESLTVFMLPTKHRKRMRTTNGIERPIQQELKRRTRQVRVFPNIEALLRLASAKLIEIDEQWAGADRKYLTFERQETMGR